MQKKWWHKKIAYQIYPKSFFDTTGTGIGDLKGIIQKLDYLKGIGIDIIWLSPCYSSPFADQGYDISDYYNIDPIFGTMQDMELLILEAKKREMYIVMDLVVNHCSDEHEWFQKALANPKGEYSKYFYIEEGVNGQPPNNWRSYFGGSAWELIPGTNLYYLHLFHKKQPDLNWENPVLREKIYEMINWWLEKGLSGFRIDAIINIKKALPFQRYQYPPDREDGMVSPERMLDDAEGLVERLQELRTNTFEKYDAFTVAELFHEKEEELPLFIGDDGCFSTIFDFRENLFGLSEKGWYASKHIQPEEYKRCCFETQKIVGNIGMMANIIENHDEPRGVSRYLPEGEASDISKKMLATIHMMLRGIPFIYQGQEIGMENIEMKSIDEFDDISTIDQYQTAIEAGLSKEEALRAVNFFSRDNCRTPFQWNNQKYAGFSINKPWLKVNPNYRTINAEAQIKQPDSVLNYYKRLVELRKSDTYSDTFTYGEMIPYTPDREGIMAFYRKDSENTILIIANLQHKICSIPLQHVCEKLLLNNSETVEIDHNNQVILQKYQALILLLGDKKDDTIQENVDK